MSLRLLSFILFIWINQAVANTLDLERARRLLDSGKTEEAYLILAPEEDNYAGNTEFDYALALSELDSGRVEKSIAVFDRILSTNPKFAGARLDLARAYFALASYDLAGQEFESALAENPPSNVSAVITNYLKAIEEKTKPKINTFTAYTEITSGHDSNFNAATSKNSIAIPALDNLFVTLASSNLETSSGYLSFASGAELTHLIKPNVYAFVGLDLKKKNGFDATPFNTGNIDGHAGVRFADEKNSYSLSIQQGRFYLGGNPSRDSTGMTAQWMHGVDAQNQLVLFGAHNGIRFVQDASKVENMNMDILGGVWVHAFDHEGKFVISPTLMIGKEFEINSRANGDKEFFGGKLLAQYRFKENASIFCSAGEQVGFYQIENAAFLTKRVDRLYDANLGVQWQINNNWSIRPQISYSKNITNIDIYQYDRKDVSITARWDFK